MDLAEQHERCRLHPTLLAMDAPAIVAYCLSGLDCLWLTVPGGDARPLHRPLGIAPGRAREWQARTFRAAT